MKTMYAVLFVSMISLSAIHAQSLTSTLQGGGSFLNVESIDPFSNITDRSGVFNFEGNDESQCYTGNQLWSTSYTQNKVKDQTAETKYLLDSLVYMDTMGVYQSKYEYLYDSKGLQTSYITYTSWDTTNKIWKGGSKTESTYDSVGHQILYIYSTWDAANKIWKIYSKYEFTFDGNGYLTNNSSFKWDATNSKWINWNKSANTYDSNGNKTLFISWLWDVVNNVWNMTNKSEYTFDGNGLQTLTLSYTYTSNVWKESSKSEYTYDSNGHRILYLTYTWDATNNVWKGNAKTEYSYDNGGLQISYSGYTWDATNNIWKVSSKTENSYDGNGHKILGLSYKWDAINNIWIENSKTKYTNNSNGNIALTNYWLYSSNVWVQNQIGTYFYSILINTSAVVISDNTKISIYPNPAINHLLISYKAPMCGIELIEIIDMQGNVLGKHILNIQNGINHENISVTHLPAGLYLLRFQSKNKLETIKFIKN